jgi:hypothetical protein
MPSETKAFFDSMKTTSFHITSIASCKVTGRVGFKINVWRETGQKRYEFEAESAKVAGESPVAQHIEEADGLLAEIIASIRNLCVQCLVRRAEG